MRVTSPADRYIYTISLHQILQRLIPTHEKVFPHIFLSAAYWSIHTLLWNLTNVKLYENLDAEISNNKRAGCLVRNKSQGIGQTIEASPIHYWKKTWLFLERRADTSSVWNPRATTLCPCCIYYIYTRHQVNKVPSITLYIVTYTHGRVTCVRNTY